MVGFKKQFLWVRSCGLFAKGLGYDFQFNGTTQSSKEGKKKGMLKYSTKKKFLIVI